MVTLMSNDKGGRCDARCYDSLGPGCKCICGGRNHGVGLKRALDNTRQMVAHIAGPELKAAIKSIENPGQFQTEMQI